MRLFVGIDGGGTKCDMVLCREDGKVLNRVFESGCNPNDIGLENCIAVLKRGIDSLVYGYEKSDIVGVFAGVSGGGITGDYRGKIQVFLEEYMGKNTVVSNHSDTLCALVNGIEDKDGCVVICGTGIIGYAREGNSFTRVAGYGFLLDKGGSGFHFGQSAISSALYHKDGRGEATMLTEMIEEKIGDAEAAVGDIYKKGRDFIASFAPMVFEAYKKGDKVAERIIAENAREIAVIFNRLCELSRAEKTRIVLAGSMWRDFDVLERFIVPLLKKECEFIIPNTPPVFGAVLQAVYSSGVEMKSNFKENFMKSVKEV